MADIRMPQLGESVTEGTLGKWLKQVGDKVVKYEPLVEVITDKVNAEIPSDVEGVLTEILVQEGETVAVGTTIAVIAEAGDAAVSGQNQDGAAAYVSASTQSVRETQAAQTQAAIDKAKKTGEKSARYSPAVMRLIQEHGLDPAQIQGTGLGGRITRKDVLRFLESGGAAVAVPQTPALKPSQMQAAELQSVQTEQMQPSGVNAQDLQAKTTAGVAPSELQIPSVQAPGLQLRQEAQPGDTVLPLTPVRRTIAKRMLESKHQAPHAWTMVEVDVTPLVKFRTKVKESFKKREGVDLTYLPFFIKAVTESLKEFPILNSTWAGDSIIVKKSINISIAIATEDALVVPVIHHADRMSITGIAHAIHDLVTKAKAGKLTIDDIQGGTFTVNNTGAFGSILSAPIINSPQAAILSMESIVKRPVVLDDDAIAIRSMVNLCLSLDHRVLDGLVCGRFLQSVKRRLQEYGDHTIL
jgi:2-oxoisovalerate dehydrogenase E2 component (dihydrolipoyl transacylase)